MRWLRGRKVTTAAVSTVVVGALVGGALIGSGSNAPAMALAPVGHWIFNQDQRTALHVDAGTGRVDATVPAPRAGDVGLAVQGPDAGYLVSPNKLTVFGKSTLSVDTAFPLNGGSDLPTAIETLGGPYLVYRGTGVVVRLGVPPASVQTGGPLTRPTYTDAGVVWLERGDSGDVCSLADRQVATTCVAKEDPTRPHALSVVDGNVGVVDLVADTFTPVGPGGPGTPRPLGVDLPADAKVADRTTSDGMLPVVLPSETPELLLVPLGSNARRGLQRVPLPPGTYQEPLATDTTATVLDTQGGALTSFGSDGVQRGHRESPAAAGGQLRRGADGDGYLDGDRGSKAFVVQGRTGAISAVDTSLQAATGATDAAPDAQALAIAPPRAPQLSEVGTRGPSNADGTTGTGAGRRGEGGSGPPAPESDKGTRSADGGGAQPAGRSQGGSVAPPVNKTGEGIKESVTWVTATANSGVSEGGEVSAKIEWGGAAGGLYDVLVDGVAKKTTPGNTATVSFDDACKKYRVTVSANSDAADSASTFFGPELDCKPATYTLLLPSDAVVGQTYGIGARPSKDEKQVADCQASLDGESLGSGPCNFLFARGFKVETQEAGVHKVVLVAKNKYGTTTASGSFRVNPNPNSKDTTTTTTTAPTSTTTKKPTTTTTTTTTTADGGG